VTFDEGVVLHRVEPETPNESERESERRGYEPLEVEGLVTFYLSLSLSNLNPKGSYSTAWTPDYVCG